MTTEEKIYEFETKSLDDLSVCLALGAEVVKVDRNSDARFFTFYLRGDFDMEAVSLQLASKTLKVCVGDRVIDAYDLLEAVRRAKSVVHQR